MEDVLVLLVIFGSITAVILGLVYLRNRNRERMVMMEKGVDPVVFKDEFKNSNFALRTGIFLIGIALGILFGEIAANTMLFPHEEAAYFSSVFLFGGVALIVGSYMDGKKKNS